MNNKLHAVIVLCAFIFNLTLISAQAPYGNAGEHTPVPFGSPETPFGYYEYLPLDFSETSGDTYPLVLFYHGWGERGNGTSDLSDILLFGPPKLIQQGTDFEAIVISPQNHDANYSAADFLSLYNYLVSNYPVDTNRVYVTGLSSGGGSTWRALQGHSDKIAAAVPICGSGFLNNPSDDLQQTPIWAFHSFNDNVISVNNTITNVNRIANSGNSVMSVYPYGNGSSSAASNNYTMSFDTETQNWTAQIDTVEPAENLAFTLYNSGGHNSWTQTYANQDVWDWMFSKGVDTTLNTEDETLDNLSLFQNLILKTIIIKDYSGLERKVEIQNSLGETVFKKQLFSNIITIEARGFPAGIYLVKITDGTNERVIKIILN